MSLTSDITQEMKIAMKSGDKARLGAIRLILAAIKQKEVDERIELDDATVLSLLDKLSKQRRESIKQYSEAKREDLVAKEQAELAVIQEFLPQQLSQAEISDMVVKTISSCNAKDVKDMGKVMAELKPKLSGRADMAEVSKLIREKLFN